MIIASGMIVAASLLGKAHCHMSMLRLQGDRRVQSVSLLDPINAPEVSGLKETIVDVRCVDERGVRYTVEMQVWTDKHFAKRVLYYACQTYIRQLKTAEEYPKLNQVICISLMDFELFPGTSCLSQHLILNKETLEHHIRDFVLVFAEFPKFTKKLSELNDELDEWLYFFRHADHLRKAPAQLHAPSVQKALQELNRYHWTPEQLEDYEKAALARGAYRSSLNTAWEKGLQKGHEQGHKEGARCKAIQIARQLLQSGVDEKIVVQTTGLSSKELKALS